jgi:hypothetical protein
LVLIQLEASGPVLHERFLGRRNVSRNPVLPHRHRRAQHNRNPIAHLDEHTITSRQGTLVGDFADVRYYAKFIWPIDVDLFI